MTNEEKIRAFPVVLQRQSARSVQPRWKTALSTSEPKRKECNSQIPANDRKSSDPTMKLHGTLFHRRRTFTATN